MESVKMRPVRTISREVLFTFESDPSTTERQASLRDDETV